MSKAWNREPQTILHKECVEYFKEHPVFERLFCGFRAKYASYGYFTGTVTLRNLDSTEIDDLEGFFRKNYHGKKTAAISAGRFEKAIMDSRFAGIAPKDILELYFQEEMTGKKEQRQEEEERWQQSFATVRAEYADTPAAVWLHNMQKMKSAPKAYLLKRYNESRKDIQEVQRMLRLGAEMINSFPCRQGTTEYLAVFAAQLTGNPHSFDHGTKDGRFLSLLVQWIVEQQNISVEKSDVFPALQEQREYLAVGLLKDDISNYALLSGVRARKKDGQMHSGMEGFLAEGEMLQVPLSVIAGWEQAECTDNEIYIVENPSVYAMLCKKWKGKKACMCMNGQPRLSSVLLLDLLAETGTKVYYAGDFDPEGLLIAQKVKRYYKGECVYWHMSAKEYKKSRSKEKLSSKRLKMLDRITDTELAATAAAVREAAVAGYQENIWKELLN